MHFDVVAGRRRLLALKLLVKRRKLTLDDEVPCLQITDAAALTASLSENVQREAMHPVDQFEAFAALVAEGRPVEDIAADFGVTPLVVQRRLRLANVSPRLLADYRANEVTLEQLMALAITDDHAAQEAAFYETPVWQRHPDTLRDHLTRDELSASEDALARFVGLAAYEAAGGSVRRDLFSEGNSGTYLTDALLLDRLAREKLVDVVEQVTGEGWSRVDVLPRVTSAELHVFRRARPDRREPTKSEAKRIAKLMAEQSAIQDRFDDDEVEMSDEEALALQTRLDATEEEQASIEKALLSYSTDVMAQAGAVVSVGHAGTVVLHRGLLSEQQASTLRGRADASGGAVLDDGQSRKSRREPGLSEKLVRRLSAHRTSALQAEVARHPHIALVLLVHHLARRVICDDHAGSSIDISALSRVDGLVTHAPDVSEAPAATGLRDVRLAWADRLPEDSDAALLALLEMAQEELLALLAVCVASTVGAIQSREGEVPARLMAQVVGLDMHEWWTPTSAGYFEHVSKAKALEAVAVFAPDHLTRLSKLKKADLASEAGRLAAGTGWLPAMLCALPEEPAAVAASTLSVSGQSESGDETE